MKKIGRKLFERSAVRVARNLLGKYLCRKIGSKTISLMITETEAYGGEDDLASHAHFGRTKRNSVMYGPGGVWYVYFTYGMHWLLNVITGKDNKPSGVLIRGVEGMNGPARVTKFLKVTGKFNNKPVSQKAGLWIAGNPKMKNLKLKIKNSPRIGVSYAGPVWSQKRWRFYIEK